jgi:hypothetical protein
MTVGGSIFLIAVGAILRYAVTDAIKGVDLATIGLILIIAGIVGLVIGLFMWISSTRDPYGPRRGRYVERDRYVDREPLA